MNFARKTAAICCGYLMLLGFAILFEACSIDDLTEIETDFENKSRLELFEKFKTKIQIAGEKINFVDSSNPNKRVISDNQALQFEGEIRSDAKEILYHYGMTDQEIIEEFGSLSSPDISLSAQVIVLLEEELAQNRLIYFMDESDYYSASLFGVNSSLAQSDDTIGGCLADAAGITAVFAILEGGSSKRMKKKAIKKAIRKVVGRSLGIVGAALAVYDFSVCMGWF